MKKHLLLLLFMALIMACKDHPKNLAENKVVNDPITPETALKSYLHNNDSHYSWELRDSYQLGESSVYELLLTSQKWRDFIWTHQLTLLVPSKVDHDGALLFVTGGSVKDGLPKWSSNKEDSRTQNFKKIAEENNAMVAILKQVPNQPLYDGLVEDQLISFTLHNYKKDKDLTWPLLFPMVKSAVSAMDAVQEFSKAELERDINRFIVSGASKRGWTTWLTGAHDKRVQAIAPMVIDVLNMPVSLDYHLVVWKEYSEQINDYIQLEIPQTVRSEDGNAITQMVDPYSYKDQLSMPKLIFIGTNDEYWPVDAVKNYINDIPGENYLHYVPNAGHDLGGGAQAFRALSAFWGKILNDKPLTQLSYNITSS
ncbi:MAG: PhoPQ-activated protein PqaA family protein, partial [Arenibacter sp.]|nr:PhoPQ-activated protein PqaA family protein [Arenibacter sp.]